MVVNTDEGATLVAAVLEGSRFTVRRYGARSGVIVVEWALGEDQYGGYVQDAHARGTPPAVTTEARALCTCEKQVNATDSCADLYGEPEAGCTRSYASDCRLLLACARGDALAPPACESPSVPSGVTHRCHVDRVLEALGGLR
jgi:hypothetical protein